MEYYKCLCFKHRKKADKYRKNKTTKDFPFATGRTAQRAYLDSFKDILPNLHGLKPTIRISEFEVQSITANDNESRKIIERILNKYLLLTFVENCLLSLTEDFKSGKVLTTKRTEERLLNSLANGNALSSMAIYPKPLIGKPV